MTPSFFVNACRRVRDWTHAPRNGRQPRFVRPRLEQLEERNLMSVEGTWTQLTGVHAPPQPIGTMMLLSDGTVMAQGAGQTTAWFRLTPNSSGSYDNGTWSQLASMSVSRLYFASNVLPDGRVFVLGGEYSSQGSITRSGEIYDPATNKWTTITPFPFSSFGDDPSQVITTADGTTKVLGGYIFGPQTELYNPSTNTWTSGGTKLRSDRSDEEGWTKLPNGDILSYDVFASVSTGVFHAQIYDPNTDTWSDASKSSDGSPLPLLSNSAVGFELGPGILLPDGRVLQLGATDNTALYDYRTNTWTAGPKIPPNSMGKPMGADDAPAAILPDGQVIFAADTPLFNGPTQLFDFDPTTNTITQLTLPTSLQNNLNSTPAYPSRMLVLPNGQLLLSTNDFGNNQMWTFTPNDSADPSWQPTISNIVDNGGGKFTLSGYQLNGISEGAAYGDDAEMSENYPIVQLQDLSGNVYYARTSDWSSTGVSAVGDTTLQTVNFTLPAGLSPGYYLVTSIANGISSYPLVLNLTGDDVAAAPASATAASVPAALENVNLSPLPPLVQQAPDTTSDASDSSTSLPSSGNTADNSSPLAASLPLAASSNAATPTLDANGPAATSSAFSPLVTYLLGKGGNSLLSSSSDGQSAAATQPDSTAAVDALFASDPFLRSL